MTAKFSRFIYNFKHCAHIRSVSQSLLSSTHASVHGYEFEQTRRICAEMEVHHIILRDINGACAEYCEAGSVN